MDETRNNFCQTKKKQKNKKNDPSENYHAGLFKYEYANFLLNVIIIIIIIISVVVVLVVAQ